MRTDIEIAQAAQLRPISEIALKAGIREEELSPYGKHIAKIDDLAIQKRLNAQGKLVLVTAITPTSAGEGKTTVSIGLTDALNRIGKKAMAALREPSMGPVFGLKGGATGGGMAQIVPMEDINLHFTGDIHAVGAANNLLAAMLDNHIQQGNALGIDPRRIVWHRCVDINDRQLRNIVSGLGGSANGVPREDSFDITVASEVMAVLCLSDSLSDLKARLSRMIVAYTYAGQPVTCGDLHAEGAMGAILKNAIHPNLVQTLEGNPTLVHGGPFANIAHGCSSVIATRTALRLSEYTVTEAGFGADLGAEKFLDIKCRLASLKPDAVVVVATVRALKMHGGQAKADLATPSLEALKKGIPNLLRHAGNIRDVYHLPCVVAINLFPTDTDEELKLLKDTLQANGFDASFTRVWAEGGAGGEELAQKVAALCESDASNGFTQSYPLDLSIEEKLRVITRRIYHGRDVILTAKAQKQLAEAEKLGFSSLPVCISKTPYSFSDDPSLPGAPED
ncbi:MAG: formate--tetrahydrofolate ligase, partial [Clostridia bacterium]|nr:formate--tetrahydrofolate ligase [Clostridia bacterium]